MIFKFINKSYGLFAQIKSKKPVSYFNLTLESLNVGILQVIEIHEEESILLHGIQSHLVVAIKTSNDDYIVIGYLTSAKKDTVFLSDHQLYTKDKPQMFKSVNPLVVEKEHLEIHVEGTAYISSPDIKEKLRQVLQEKFNNNESCYKYIPKGIDLKTLEKVIAFKNYENDSKILKAFAKYEDDIKQKQNQYNAKAFETWKTTQNKALGKIHKCKWPEDAEQLKKKYENL